MNIGFVCTNFNNSAFTKTAVESFCASKKHFHRVVVVDNNSDPDEAQLLRDGFEGCEAVEVIYRPDNLGYFRGLNVGIEHLRSRYLDLDWIVVGNNDLEFPIDFCDNLAMHIITLCKHAVVAPDVVTDDGLHQNPHVISRISKIREFCYDVYYCNYYFGMLVQQIAAKLRFLTDRGDEAQWRTARSIHQGHGSCYILGPRFFEQFSELWAPTFMMSEEYFLSKQLGDVGHQVYYEPSLRILHHCHATLSLLPNRKRWEMARDAHRVYRQYVGVFR